MSPRSSSPATAMAISTASSFPHRCPPETPCSGFRSQSKAKYSAASSLWIQHLSGSGDFSPVAVDYTNAINVVGTHRPPETLGRSLILNGHIDVVPVGPTDMWSRPPFDPHVEGDWLYGRGSGDMKAGLAANILLAALKTVIGILGHSPALLADGINSTSDVAYYVVVSVFVRLARKPPDPEHPYGHRQLESISAVVVGAFVVSTAIAIFWTAVRNVYDLWTGQAEFGGATGGDGV